MMTVNPIKDAGQAESYYSKQDDYYREREQATNGWQGALSREMDLSGEVKSDDLKAALEGKTDQGQLGRNRVDDRGNAYKDHNPGYDMTFSAPKGVSTVGLVGGNQDVIKAHDEAVKAALQKVEERTCTRIRENGELRHERTGKLAAATFQHETNRNCEAQLHTHCVIPNITQSADGQYRSLDGIEFFRAQREATEIYHQELASRLREKGYQVERTEMRSGAAVVDIKGVPQDLKEMHSSRRTELVEALKKRGIDPGAASRAQRQTATLTTRQTKQPHSHEALRQAWRDQAKQNGHADNLETLKAQAQERADQQTAADRTRDAEKAVEMARQSISERDAQFTGDRLKKDAIHHSLGSNARTADIEKAIVRQKEQGHIIDRGGGYYTTPEAMQREKDMLQMEKQGRHAMKPICTQEKAISAIQQTEKETGFTMNRGQREATEGILTGKNRITGIQGYAGTAKTTSVLRTVARESQAQGKEVIGLAPTHSAKDSLADGAKIDSTDTVQGFLQREKAHTPEQLDRGEVGGRTIIVDEASMLSAKDMHALVKNAEIKGDQVVLVGDVKQLGSVEAGRSFEQLQQNGMETHELAQIVRQRNEDLRQGVEAAIQRDAEKAMTNIEKNGQVKEYDTAEQRRNQMAKDYAALSQEQRNKTIVIDPSRQGRAELNDKIRAELKENGELGKDHDIKMREKKDLTNAEKKSVNGYERGDKVEFARDYKQNGIEKGREYTVKDRDPERGTVKIEDKHGNEREFFPGKTAARNVQAYQQRETELAKGDKVAFTANDKEKGITNGTRGEVKEIDDHKATIETEKGKEVQLDLTKAQDLRHAYAQTAHQAQGQTADRVMTHAESYRENLVNDKNFYVITSRAKDEVRIYTDDREKLVDAIRERSGEKSAALDEHGEAKEREPEKEQTETRSREADRQQPRKEQEPAREYRRESGRDRKMTAEEKADERAEWKDAKQGRSYGPGQGRELNSMSTAQIADAAYKRTDEKIIKPLSEGIKRHDTAERSADNQAERMDKRIAELNDKIDRQDHSQGKEREPEAHRQKDQDHGMEM